MAKFILGKKLGMSTVYDEKRGALNVTLILCEPNKITQIRTPERDGYSATQIGLEKAGSKKGIKTKNLEGVREFKFKADDKKVGEMILISQFQVGEKVKVTGISKAKGFQGVMKRHGFKGSPKSHGHKHDWRAPGSIGSSFPEHVIKGKRMAGRMGGEKSSVKNLEIVQIDEANNILFLKGAVPGVKGRIVEIILNKA